MSIFNHHKVVELCSGLTTPRAYNPLIWPQAIGLDEHRCSFLPSVVATQHLTEWLFTPYPDRLRRRRSSCTRGPPRRLTIRLIDLIAVRPLAMFLCVIDSRLAKLLVVVEARKTLQKDWTICETETYSKGTARTFLFPRSPGWQQQ